MVVLTRERHYLTSFHKPEDVHSFCRFCSYSYYWSFVAGFATVSHTLTQLTAKGEQFEWDEYCEHAFRWLKEALASVPMLAYPDPLALMVLDTDMSGVGLGAVLSQNDAHNQEWVLDYASRSLMWLELKGQTRVGEEITILFSKYKCARTS